MQALFYQLRTSKEDFTVIKRQHQAHLAKYASRQSAEASSSSQATESESTATGVKTESAADGTAAVPSGSDSTSANSASVPPHLSTPLPQPWERVEDILNMLKTAVPLLALSMEKMVDQIQTRGKPPPEEDIYRFITALLMDGMQVSDRAAGV